MKTCDVCHEPLNGNNRVGACRRTPACRKENNRRKLEYNGTYSTCECGNRKTARHHMCQECRRKLDDPQPFIKDGYRFVPAPNHPRRSPKTGKTGYVREHILVMEQMLGRYLLPGETVHHKNDQRADNVPGNLQLRSGNHGPGAAFQCLDCGSTNVLAVSLA